VDARGNWWGTKTLGEMVKLGEGGNISAIEDFHDKPDTFYRDKAYPRDRVLFSPWEPQTVPHTDPPASSFARIKGKVVFGGNPVPGERVHAYVNAAGSFKGQGFTYSAPTAADGSYSMNLPKGSYFLVVKGPRPPFPSAEPGVGSFFGFYGGNPVTVGAGSVETFTIQADRKPK